MGFLTLSFLTHCFLTQPLIKEKEARAGSYLLFIFILLLRT